MKPNFKQQTRTICHHKTFASQGHGIILLCSTNTAPTS